MQKKGEFGARSIAGETIIVPVRGQVGDLESIYNFNEVATLIWSRIDGHTSVSQIAEAVSGEFDVAPEDAEEDTSEFIKALEIAGIIEPAVNEG